jgi:hypothetical protein
LRRRIADFHERLEVIAKAIVNYERFEPLLIRYQDLAKELLRQTTPNP